MQIFLYTKEGGSGTSRTRKQVCCTAGSAGADAAAGLCRMVARPSTQHWLKSSRELRMHGTEQTPPSWGAPSSQKHLAAPTMHICPSTSKSLSTDSYFYIYFYKPTRKFVMLPSWILTPALVKCFPRTKTQVSDNALLTRQRLDKPVGAGSPADADHSHPARGPLHHHLPLGKLTKHSRSPFMIPPHQGHSAPGTQHYFPQQHSTGEQGRARSTESRGSAHPLLTCS